MILTCQSCAARFLLPDERFEGVARKVKCGQCGHVWTQDPPPPSEAEMARRMKAVAAAMERPAPQPGEALDQGGIDSLFDDVTPDQDWGAIAEDEAAKANTPANRPMTEADAKAAQVQALLDGADPSAPSASAPKPIRASAADTDLMDDLPSVPGDPFEEEGFDPIPESLKYGALEDAAVAKARRQRRQMMMGWASVAGVVLMLASGVVVLRHQIAQAVPQTRSLYQIGGLDVDSSTTGLSLEEPRFVIVPGRGGKQRVVVRGVIVNSSQRHKLLPALRAEIEGADGQLIFTWQIPPDAQTLAPGTQLPFDSRVEADLPDPDSANVYVTFDVE